MRYFFLACFLFVFLVQGLTDTSKGHIKGQFYRTEIKLVPEKTHYHVSESFTAVFRNNYGNTIYVVKASGTSPLMVLQKWDGENWGRVNTARRGVGGIQAVSYRELNFGEDLKSQFPADRLIENEVNVPGLYRYILTFFPSQNRDERIVVTSPEFRVEE